VATKFWDRVRENVFTTASGLIETNCKPSDVKWRSPNDITTRVT
jgi:hypothetical protein